jgi:hypothetical protein
VFVFVFVCTRFVATVAYTVVFFISVFIGKQYCG